MTRATAEQIVDAILGDLSYRRGLHDVWDECDEAVQNEICDGQAFCHVLGFVRMVP